MKQLNTDAKTRYQVSTIGTDIEHSCCYDAAIVDTFAWEWVIGAKHSDEYKRIAEVIEVAVAESIAAALNKQGEIRGKRN